MSTKIESILNAKSEAGENAYLWLHEAGDCILWPDEEISRNDNGRNAVARWKLSKSEVAELISTGECDELA